MKFQHSAPGMSRTLAIVCTLSLGLVLPAVGRQASSGQEIVSDSGTRKVRSRTNPEYPALARQLNVTGKVKIEVTIAPDGHVSNTKTVGGSPLLVASATDAIRKWRYEIAPKESTEVVVIEFSKN